MLSAQLTGRIIIGWLFVFPPPPPGCQGPETCHGVIIIIIVTATLIIFTITIVTHLLLLVAGHQRPTSE